MSDDSSSLISLKDAGYYSYNRWLVRHINLQVNKGEIVTLIGPNGGGKSTTVKMALGLLKITEGHISRQKNLSIGYMPQKLSINWTMPLQVQRLMQLTHKSSQKAIDEALDKVDALKLKKQDAQSLSGGEFQRVLLARAILNNPDLLVLDEPVQGVDFSGEKQLYNLITQIRDESKCGILMISHDLHVVMASTDMVICLNGHICCQGHPSSLEGSEDYASFMGMNVGKSHAVYTHSHDHDHGPDGCLIPHNQDNRKT